VILKVVAMSELAVSAGKSAPPDTILPVGRPTQKPAGRPATRYSTRPANWALRSSSNEAVAAYNPRGRSRRPESLYVFAAIAPTTGEMKVLDFPPVATPR
jgi:hypothetical protein